MNYLENIVQSLESLKQNKLRSGLTLLSVAIGVFSIISVGTLVGSLNATVNNKLDELGENTFFVTKTPSFSTGRDWRKYHSRKNISYKQYKELKKRMTLTDQISPLITSAGFTVQFEKYKTDPDVMLIGADEYYFKNNNFKIESGRPIVEFDINNVSEIAIVGKDVLLKIFKNNENPIGKKIKIKNHQYTIAGVLEPKGATMGRSEDNLVCIPVTTFIKYYSSEDESLQLTLKAESKELLSKTMDESIGHLRSIRGVKPSDENDFELATNESLSDQFSSFTDYLFYFGFICGSISILAAGVGIMNIMLVAVKERTKEIGVRKAVGAKKGVILTQFIIEAITLSQIGGIIGIFGGIAVGGLASVAFGFTFAIPWAWVVVSVTICTILGVLSGYYPARKAANLDPIEALRYE